MKRIIARVWRSLGSRLQWRLLWFRNAKFMVGVTGVVKDRDGRVLLLRHRLWPEGRQWGLPTGAAKRGERFEDTVRREVYEETGLTVEVGRLVKLSSGYQLRVDIAYAATLVGDFTPVLAPMEVLEARLFSPDDLPEGLLESHRRLIKES